MFEVQLGAGLLLQFRPPRGQPVRVLADAGVHASGYPADHVHQKLKNMGKGRRGEKIDRIDLIVGTHYDKDHLAGLVPIIEDPAIAIGEAWLPPVADDTDVIAEDVVVRSEHLLTTKFSGESGEAHLHKYLSAKAHICEQAHLWERATVHRHGGRLPPRAIGSGGARLFSKGFDRASAMKYFTHQLDEAAHEAGEPNDACHADSTITAATRREDIVQLLQQTAFEPPALVRRGAGGSGPTVIRAWQDDPDLARNHRFSLAQIRKSAAKDAINALSLNAVVTALKRRRIPIRSYVIQDGQPIRFVWDASSQQFLPSRRARRKGTELQLLGPSQSLVDEHAKRLPTGDYLRAAVARRLPVKAITPSNELSYVIRFDHAGQKVLISGDAGCVDFKKNRKDFYPKLIAALDELHVIQIAHHAGNNAEFYNALLASGYPEQTARSFLLLSHATADKHRPSELFAQFVGEIRTDGDDFSLLFTSQPSPERVTKFRKLVHAPVGTRGTVGDVQLQFNGKRWNVVSHAVSV